MIDIQWMVGGEAGYGIMTTGAMMAKIFTRFGLSVFDYVEYPSLIRGGHNAYYVRGADFPIYSQKRGIDVLVALNRQTIDKHKDELVKDSVIIYDPNVTKVDEGEFPAHVKLAPVPLLEITKQVGADRLMINTVSVGASLALFHSDYGVLHEILEDAFGRKGEHVVAENVDTSRSGFDYVTKTFPGLFPPDVVRNPKEQYLIGGAEAVALGAIRAGVQFSAIYPMTPINGILTVFAAQALRYGIVVKEPEDEIAGINMAIGASFAGARSMVATSGGGFSLMTEALGLAAQTETPLVIVMGSRPGPATGMPTWTDQGDLRFVLHAAQGEFPRIIVAPGDVTEAFTYTMQAFNLADKYQMPVIVLVDKYLMEGHTTVDQSNFKLQMSNFKLDRGKILTDQQAEKETEYKRYLFTDDGVSPRSLPGQKGGIGLSGSDEHDERGLYNEESENRIKMMDKRFKKLETAMAEFDAPVMYGGDDGAVTILSFGSTKYPILEAMRLLGEEKTKVNFSQVAYIHPFPADHVASVIKKAKKTLVIENNKLGQFEGLIREKTGLSVTDHLRKYDGRPFYPEEIVEKIKSMI